LEGAKVCFGCVSLFQRDSHHMLPNGTSSGSGGGGGGAGLKRKGYDGREETTETLKARLVLVLSETEELKGANHRDRNELVIKHNKEVAAMRSERAVQAAEIRELELALEVKKHSVEPPQGLGQREALRLRVELKKEIEEFAEYKKSVELRRVSQGFLFIAELNTLQKKLEESKAATFIDIADEGKLAAKIAEIQRQADERVEQVKSELYQSQAIELKLTALVKVHEAEQLARSLAVAKAANQLRTSATPLVVPSSLSSLPSLPSLPLVRPTTSSSSSTSLLNEPVVPLLPPADRPLATHGVASRAIARCRCIECEGYRERTRATRSARRQSWAKVEVASS
jgi:hypothetical protein